MKNILILFLLLVGTTSCDNLLDVHPTDQYSAITYWTDKENYDAALTGCYESLYGVYSVWGGFYSLEMITPNSHDYHGSLTELGNGSALSSNTIFLNFWRRLYGGIGRTNTFLDQIENAPFDDTDKAQMKGQALFLRALFYSQLIDLFGDCPLITQTPNMEAHGKLPRTPVEDVVTKIIADLDEAAGKLPVSYSSSNIGRATKGATLALKARILLFNKKWIEAAQTAKEVVDLGVFDLFPDYRGMYMPANENNVEIIFDVQYQSPHKMHNADSDLKTLNRNAPLKNLVDAYLMIDGKSITESSLYNPDHPYENRDPRLHQTIVCIGYPYNGKITKAEDVVTTGFGQKKLTSYPDDQTINITMNNSELNLIVIRYAEILLTYAEALNEAGASPSDEVYWAINQIRKRPTVNMPEIDPGLNKEQMREVIRLERRIELAGEGLYYADIKRWKTAEIVNNGSVYNYKGEVIEVRVFDKDKHYLWPIPADEIQINDKLIQNPGW